MDPNEKPGMNSGDHEGKIRLNVAYMMGIRISILITA